MEPENEVERAPRPVAQETGARERRFRVLWALALLPLFLGVVAAVASTTSLRFLLYPPPAAIGFALFLAPYHPRASFQSVVIGPVAGAVIGVAALIWLPVGPARVVAVTALGIAALALLRAELTPALAVSLLTLLVGASGLAYIISIALSSFALWALFLLWRRVVYALAYPADQAPAPCTWGLYTWIRSHRR